MSGEGVVPLRLVVLHPERGAEGEFCEEWVRRLVAAGACGREL